MKKALLIILVIAAATAAFVVLNPFKKGPLISSNLQEVIKVNEPSGTFINYADPAGFVFSYPDNLSITKNETTDSDYADITLSSKDASGSLNLKIADSKFKTLDEWLKLNKAAAKEEPKEVKLGNLKAMEVKTSDRLYLGALDQGVLFTIEMPLIEEDFWMKVYEKVISGFSFTSPETVATGAGSEVIFEGEEVVE
mgnify:CR=1 FL=1